MQKGNGHRSNIPISAISWLPVFSLTAFIRPGMGIMVLTSCWTYTYARP